MEVPFPSWPAPVAALLSLCPTCSACVPADPTVQETHAAWHATLLDTTSLPLDRVVLTQAGPTA